MDTSTFFHTVLGDEGWYCVFAAKDGKVKQKFYEDIKYIEKVAGQFDDSEYDTYFSLATFEEPGSRKVDNALYLKSFFIDLDCGENKEYANQQEALEALKLFCTEQGFEKPLLINSGYGVHAYWPLAESVSAEVWAPVAEAFKRLCLSSGLHIDPAVTADVARVLRVPGTHNRKQEPIEVGFFGNSNVSAIPFADFKSKVGEITEIKPTPNGSLFDNTITSHDNSVLSILAGNSQSSFKKILEKTAKGKGCQQIGHLVQKQHDTPEPLWRAGLSIAKFCVDGEKAVHVISRNYPEYDPDETERKANAIKGPYLCSKFDELSPGLCEGCPMKGKIKSPIVLGREILEAEEDDNIYEEPEKERPAPAVPTRVIPSYPKPYFRGKTGGVYVRSTTSDGDIDERVVYHNDLYVTRRIRDPEMGECLVIRLHLPKDGVREFLLSLTAATSREEFRKEMSKQGVAILKMDDLMGYITAWVNDLQAKSIADEARMQFGWTDEMDGFILGDREYTEDTVGINHPSSATAQYFPMFDPKGTLEGWKTAMEFYNQPGLEFHQFCIGAGFGAPLMEFIPNISAAMLHIHSKDSGFGKTTLKWAMASIWGDYRSLVVSEEDTKNFTMHRVEVTKNIPALIDEMTNHPAKQMSSLIYTACGGKQRGRMSASVNKERRRGDPWSTLFISSANASMLEKVASEKTGGIQAEAQRMMEKRVDKVEVGEKINTDDFNKLLSENYGHAGPVFITYVLKNQLTVKKLLNDIQVEVDQKFNLTHQNRFWSAFITCALAGAVIAKKLGLVEYDTRSLFKEAGLLVKENREASHTVGKDVMESLNDYLRENYSGMLVIKSSRDMRAERIKKEEPLDQLVSPTMQPRTEFVARYEPDTKMLALALKPLRIWCVKQQVNFSEFQAELIKFFGAEKKKVRLSKGTNVVMPPCNSLVMDSSEFADDLPIEAETSS